jgi:hypothetical protein
VEESSECAIWGLMLFGILTGNPAPTHCNHPRPLPSQQPTDTLHFIKATTAHNRHSLSSLLNRLTYLCQFIQPLVSSPFSPTRISLHLGANRRKQPSPKSSSSIRLPISKRVLFLPSSPQTRENERRSRRTQGCATSRN